MKIELAGKPALVLGSGGAIAAAVGATLTENGATVNTARFEDSPAQRVLADSAASGKPWLLVVIHPGAERLPTDDDAATDTASGAADLAALVRAFASSLKRVVFVFSVAGLVPLRSHPRFSAEQAGLVSTTRTLAMECGAAGLAVNAVAVGAFDEVGANLLTHAAVKRPARLSEIVAAVLFLADPDNTYTTGHVATVDGGFAAGYARNF